MYYSFDEGEGLLDSTPYKKKPSREFLNDIREESSNSDISFVNRNGLDKSSAIHTLNKKRSFNR